MRVRKIAEINLPLLCLYVRPSVQVEQLGSHWTDINEVWYLNICRKSVEKKFKIWDEWRVLYMKT